MPTWLAAARAVQDHRRSRGPRASIAGPPGPRVALMLGLVAGALGVGAVAIGPAPGPSASGALVASVPGDSGAQPASPAGSAPAPMALYEGVSRPSDVRELAFGIRGRIAELLVAAGDDVSAGQAIVRMEDSVQVQTVALARLQAEDQTSLNAAIVTADYRDYDLAQVRSAFESGGANERELKDAEYRATQAKADVEAARQNLAQSAVALAREEARLAEMTIHSPIDATVVDVHRHPGEAVDESTNVVTVIRVDPLWMDVNVSVTDALRLRREGTAEVRWQDVPGLDPVTGRVIFVSPAGHAGARQVMVRLEIPNPDLLPTGMHGTVRFLDAGDAGGAASARVNAAAPG